MSARIVAHIDFAGESKELVTPIGRYVDAIAKGEPGDRFAFEYTGVHDHGKLPELRQNWYLELKESIRVRAMPAMRVRVCVLPICARGGPTSRSQHAQQAINDELTGRIEPSEARS